MDNVVNFSLRTARAVARFGRAILPGSTRTAVAAPAHCLGDSSWARSLELMLPANGGGTLALSGSVAGRPCKLELGRPSRDYIVGNELRARADLGLDDSLAVIVMSRALRNVLAQRAYSTITDTVQTAMHSSLPEEMRWLAIYDEVSWRLDCDADFWQRYVVLARESEEAVAWIDSALLEGLLGRPPATAGQPFVAALLRGKCYLRAQYPAGHAGDDLPGLFATACESAVRAFG